MCYFCPNILIVLIGNKIDIRNDLGMISEIIKYKQKAVKYKQGKELEVYKNDCYFWQIFKIADFLDKKTLGMRLEESQGSWFYFLKKLFQKVFETTTRPSLEEKNKYSNVVIFQKQKITVP